MEIYFSFKASYYLNCVKFLIQYKSVHCYIILVNVSLLRLFFHVTFCVVLNVRQMTDKITKIWSFVYLTITDKWGHSIVVRNRSWKGVCLWTRYWLKWFNLDLEGRPILFLNLFSSTLFSIFLHISNRCIYIYIYICIYFKLLFRLR